MSGQNPVSPSQIDVLAKASDTRVSSDGRQPYTQLLAFGGRRPSWRRVYARRLLALDAAVIAAVLVVSELILAALGIRRVYIGSLGGVDYAPVMVAIGLCWLLALELSDARDEHVVGHGTTEYRRLAHGTLGAFISVIGVAFLLRADLSRGFVLLATPIGITVLLFARWLARQWLRRQQRNGLFVHRAVVIGEVGKLGHILTTIRANADSGYQIVGVITRHGAAESVDDAIPVIGDFANAVEAIDRCDADTLIVAGSDDLGPRRLRRLGWAMAERDIEWIVAPAMTDIAGPRIHVRPVAGLPLVHISFPVLEGGRRLLKRTFDVVLGSLLAILLSPVMLGVALTVKLTSSGPVFYRQERIGRRGKPFGMLKFRSMVQNADAQLASLLAEQGTDDKPLFKVENDPRITPVGRVLRKYSLDELPQLFNVVLGEMSLVGPRPQREAEVALYDAAAHRRLLVKPGMSGLWQVSGRSALSWEDALRLDLYYVENWSLGQDVMILLRTFRAVITPEGTAR